MADGRLKNLSTTQTTATWSWRHTWQRPFGDTTETQPKLKFSNQADLQSNAMMMYDLSSYWIKLAISNQLNFEVPLSIRSLDW